MPQKIRTFAEEKDYVSRSLPSIERRSLMESSMRRPTTRADVLVICVFLVVALGLLAYFLSQ